MTPEQIAAQREVIADVWRRMNEVAFVTKDRPHGNLGPPSAGTEAVYAGNFLATLHSVGYELVPLDHIDTLTAAEPTAGELAEWLDSFDGRVEDIFALWTQGKRSSRWAAEQLIDEGHIARLGGHR